MKANATISGPIRLFGRLVPEVEPGPQKRPGDEQSEDRLDGRVIHVVADGDHDRHQQAHHDAGRGQSDQGAAQRIHAPIVPGGGCNDSAGC